MSELSELQVDVRHAKHQREMDARRQEKETRAILSQPVEVRLLGPKDDVIVKAARNDVIIVSPPTGHLSLEERYFISSIFRLIYTTELPQIFYIRQEIA